MLDPIVPYLIIVSAFMVIMLKAALSDLLSLRISNRDNAILLILYPLYLSFTPVMPDFLMSFGIALCVLLIGFVLFSKGVLGAGDVKMLAIVSLWAGPALISPFLLVTACAGGVLAILMISRLQLEAAVLAHRCGAVRLSAAITNQVLPYGVAIAAGGGYVAYRLISLAGA